MTGNLRDYTAFIPLALSYHFVCMLLGVLSGEWISLAAEKRVCMCVHVCARGTGRGAERSLYEMFWGAGRGY